mmetsp:Transcript_49888/g.99282  ORF Transcript_49888/g.99282 Transcript_49888/m.99282 type:complete len:106 (-) Transcript_49888:282-599(-)
MSASEIERLKEENAKLTAQLAESQENEKKKNAEIQDKVTKATWGPMIQQVQAKIDELEDAGSNEVAEYKELLGAINRIVPYVPGVTDLAALDQSRQPVTAATAAS